MTEDKTIELVRRRFQLAKENQAPHFERLRMYRQVYRASRDPSIYTIPTRAQYVVPLAFEKVENVIPKIIAVLFSVSPPIQSRWRVGKQNSDEDLKLRVLDHLFEWHYDSNFTPSLYWKVYGWIKDALIYGQSYVKVGWKHRIRKEKQKLSLLTKLGFSPGTEEKVVEDGVDVQNPSIFDLYFAPEAKAPYILQTSPYVIEHTQKRRSKILEQRGKQYLDFDENLLYENKDEDLKSQLDADLDRNATDEDDHDDPLIDLYEHWEDERLIVTANHCVKLRDEPNPFGLPQRAKRKPYVCAIDYLILNELWQAGEVEMVKDMQNELTTIRRMRTDVNNLIINPMWLINSKADVNEAELGLSRPGGFVHAMPEEGKLDQAVIPLRPSGVTGLSSEDYQMIQKEADDVTGQQPYSMGESPQRRETATAVQLLQAAGNSRMDIKVRSMSHSFMEFNWMVFERWKQLLTTPHPLRIPMPGTTGFQYVQVTKDLLPEYDDVDLVAQGDPSMLLKDQRKQEIAQLYEIINNNPFVQPQTKLRALMLVLKSRELEGIEDMLGEIENMMAMLPQIPTIALPPPNGGPQEMPGESPQAPGPMRPEGAPQANESSPTFAIPRPNR